MSIPSEIQSLIDRLNLELETIEQEAIEGETLLRQLMSLFPNNALLIQFFAYWQTTRFFVVNAKRRIDETREQLEESEIVSELGADLAALLGETIETKIRSRAILDRLRNLS